MYQQRLKFGDEDSVRTPWSEADPTAAAVDNLFTYTGSLTTYFQEEFRSAWRFHLRFANWGDVDLDERRQLSLPENGRAWVRHIEHRINGALWVLGRVVFSESTKTEEFDSVQAQLCGLGVQSIGTLLFCERAGYVKRGAFRFAQLEASHFDAAWRLVFPPIVDAVVWARRSNFIFKGQTLVVTEVFLPPACETIVPPKLRPR